MNILRRLGLSLAILLFSLSISLVALFISLYSIMSTPQPVKQALSASGIYSVAVADTLAQQTSGAVSSVSTTDPIIQQALKQALPPTFLQDSSNQTIDSVYAWLQGTTPSPTFSIDLTQVKSNFADTLATLIQQKLDALPLCSNLVAPPASVDDALSFTCMPRGVSSSQLASTVRQEALSNGLFSGTNTISADTFKDSKGKPVTDSLKIAPQIYHYYTIGLYALPLLTLLLVVAIIFWSSTKRAGIKRVAWIFITTGLGIMILAAIEVWLLHAGISFLNSAASTSTLQDKLYGALEILVTDMRTWWFGAGAAYVIIAIILFIVVKFNPAQPTLPMGDSRNGELPPLPISPTSPPPTTPVPPI